MKTLLVLILFSLVFVYISFYAAEAQPTTQQHVPPPSNNQYGNLYSNFDPTIAVVVVVLICTFFFMGIFAIFIRQCADSGAVVTAATAAAAGGVQRVGVDPQVIEKFPVFIYSDVKDVKIGRGTLECAICLSEFEDDENLRLLPKCNHVFHPECIDAWLTCHATCPVCRANLTLIDDSATCQNLKSPIQQIPSQDHQQITDEVAQQQQQLQVQEVVISVNEEPSSSTNSSSSSNTVNIIKNQPPRSGISGKFPRSHSTGHSLVQLQAAGDNLERYTLRFPEELRTKIMASAKLKRAMSFNVILAKEGSCSSRKGYRNGEGSSRGKQMGRSERWALLISSTFITRSSSIQSLKINNNNEGDGSVHGRNLLASVKMPLNCMNVKVDGVEEQSTTRARPPI